MSDRELLEDTSFDREVVPKDQEGDLLVSLLKNGAFGEDSSVLLSKYPIKDDQLERLVKENRVVLVSHSPIKVYLTKIGKIVATGEYALRERERKHK